MADSTAQAEPLIELDGIGKVFTTDEVETHALSEVSLTIHEGEYVAVAGPSGSGKSTLLSILGLLELPTQGRYLLKGIDTSALAPARRARIRNCEVGFIFQAFNLIGDLTVVENVELPLTYRGIPAAERRRRAQEVLATVGLAHRTKHYPFQLSGGQQQRVAVARALVGNPSLLLADEPTGNLDSKSGHAVMELLGRLHEAGATLCTVTHDPHFASMAGRVVHILDGCVQAEAPAPQAGGGAGRGPACSATPEVGKRR